MTAKDIAGNLMKKSWTFTTYPATSVTSVRVLGNRCVELTFSQSLRLDGELLRPSNYAFPVRLGYAAEVYARDVTAGAVSSGVVKTVTVCVRGYFSLNGRYGVRVRGPLDEFGRVVDTGGTFNVG